MAWFRRGSERDDDPGDSARRAEPSMDTVGNPIVDRAAGDPARHSAPDTGMTRAEGRMLEFVADGRVARTVSGGAAGGFWRIDGAFATGTKAMMLDWLFEQGYIGLGPRVRVVAQAVLTAQGREALEQRQ